MADGGAQTEVVATAEASGEGEVVVLGATEAVTAAAPAAPAADAPAAKTTRRAQREQVRRAARAVRHQRVALPTYQPKQVLMTDLLREVAARRAGTSPAPAPQPCKAPDVVVVIADEAEKPSEVPESEGGAGVESKVNQEDKEKDKEKEEEEEEEARQLREEKQREWAEEEREVERVVQRYTSRLAGGWQQRFREQAARDADPHHRHQCDPRTSALEEETQPVEEEEEEAFLSVTATDALVDDGAGAAHDIDSLLADDTPAAREHLRQQCLRRKRRRLLDAEALAVASTATNTNTGTGTSMGTSSSNLGDTASRSFGDERSRQLLRRIQRTNVAAAAAPAPMSPQVAFAREESRSRPGHAAASLALALRGLCGPAGSRSPDPGRSTVTGALFRTVSSPCTGTGTDADTQGTPRSPAPVTPAAGQTQAKSRSLFQLLSQHQSK